MIVFDTDHFPLFEWAENAEARRLRERVESVLLNERATTIVTYEEQTRGWLAKLAEARSLVQLVRAFGKLSKHLKVYGRIEVLPFDEQAAAEFQRLRNLRLRIGTKDLQIAAIILAHDATLRSRNLRDFGRVPGLKVEDWTS